MRVSPILVNQYKNENRKKQTPAFGGLTNNRMFNAIESSVAEGCARLVSTKTAQSLVEKTNKTKGLPEKLTSHLIVLGSTILSAFYVGKTINNKKMDESKRKTLAVNQGLVWGASTVMAYSFDGWARKKFNKIFDKFQAANNDASSAEMKKWKNGFGLARTIIIVDMVYRFIAPVIVTPMANYIGNKLKKQG